MSSFSIDASCDGSALRLACSGELDASACAVLEEAVRAHVAVGAEVVVLDLSAVAFIDSCGISTVVRATRDLRASGASLQVEHPSRVVRRAFEMCGLLGVIDVGSGPALV